MPNNPYNDDKPAEPIFINLPQQVSTSSKLINSSATFYRTSDNTNQILSIPVGTFINQADIYVSPISFLQNELFVSTNDSPMVDYHDNVDIRILSDITCYYHILINYKITKNNGTNYSNQREIRVNLIKSDRITPYNNSLMANSMPDSGVHDKIIISGYASHLKDDLVKLGFMIIQDSSHSDFSDTLLTVFGISINIL